MTISNKEHETKLCLLKNGNLIEDTPLKIEGHTWLKKAEQDENNKKENLIFKVVWKKRDNNELMGPSFFMY